jgi:hypothetical protein
VFFLLFQSLGEWWKPLAVSPALHSFPGEDPADAIARVEHDERERRHQALHATHSA